MFVSGSAAFLCSEHDVRSEAEAFISAWLRKAKCWSCERHLNSELIRSAVRVAETMFVFMPLLGEEQRWAWDAYPHAFWDTCLPAAMLAAFLLLRYSIDGPRTDHEINTAYRWYDFWGARLLEVMEGRAEREGGARHFFDVYGVTADQLRYLQWQNRFKDIGYHWRNKDWPGLANVTVLQGVGTCPQGAYTAQGGGDREEGSYDIFDFGAGRGWDDLFFTKGVRCRTLAVDADWRNIRWLKKIFRPLLLHGQLTLLHAAIVPSAHTSARIPFCLYTESEWSEQPQGPISDYCVKVEDVPAWTCLDIADRFGLPSLYWKMDIEESELDCLRSLRLAAPSVRERLPPYVSVESPRGPAPIAEAFRLLEGLGFRRFKLVSQQIYSERRSDFGIYSSGLFGEEAVDEVSGRRWRTSREVRGDALGCYGGNQSSTAGLAEGWEASRRGFLRACWSGHAHFDIHAARGSA